ncbi:MAG: ABC transporter ATP-binding protein [Elusimicrobia bacterium RIFCSPLOWO2_01_FULL_59_12]|nr:MAG: ABC transporter ATP-binding protein [Elusimicrobia bacterium RIFCSPLOWO2_01_FULL_59_12]
MLEIKELRTLHGRKIEALRGVSLSVAPGEMIALIGGNGAGKTTLLRSIAGLLPPDSGEIIFQGRSIARKPSHRVAALGVVYVPEGRRVFPRLTVRENLEMGAFLRRDRIAIAEDLERLFHLFPVLRDRQKQLGSTLSGGEQQMLAIARALMSRPKLLMLDEPSMGLAPLMVEKIFSVIQEIHRQGMTLLMVEQNARKALQIAQRAYVLETGKIVLQGLAKDLLHNPQVQHAYLGIE